MISMDFIPAVTSHTVTVTRCHFGPQLFSSSHNKVPVLVPVAPVTVPVLVPVLVQVLASTTSAGTVLLASQYQY
jgi:hypothetical protein